MYTSEKLTELEQNITDEIEVEDVNALYEYIRDELIELEDISPRQLIQDMSVGSPNQITEIRLFAHYDTLQNRVSGLSELVNNKEADNETAIVTMKCRFVVEQELEDPSIAYIDTNDRSGIIKVQMTDAGFETE